MPMKKRRLIRGTRTSTKHYKSWGYVGSARNAPIRRKRHRNALKRKGIL